MQVCYNLDDESTFNREIKGLVKTCQKFDLKKGYIINLEQDNTILVDGINISIVPAWRYLIENNR